MKVFIVVSDIYSSYEGVYGSLAQASDHFNKMLEENVGDENDIKKIYITPDERTDDFTVHIYYAEHVDNYTYSIIVKDVHE